jgi:hypothetical protein
MQLHTSVVRACQGEPDLEQAMFSIKPTCEALFSDLRASLQVAINRTTTQYLQEPLDAYYTDRRYNSARDQRFLTSRARGYRQQRSFGTRPRPPDSRTQAPKRCFVCHKEGCWSTNHPRTDRTRATKQYIASHEGFFEETPSNGDVILYIQQFEGEEEVNVTPYDSEDDLLEGEEDGDQVVHYLTTTAYLHRTTAEDTYKEEPEECADQFTLDDRYRTTYQGELWDTGAAKISTVGRAQLEAYVRENPDTIIDWTPSQANISFGGQNPRGSIGTVRIQNPIGTVTYHILDTNTPFLLSLADADKLGAYFNNVRNVIVRKDKTTIPVVRKWGHPFFNVNKEESMSFFTELELRRLHRRFGHPRTERLHKMLTNAGHDVNAEALRAI